MVIIAGGTGNPYFTTDSAAALRALEIQAGADSRRVVGKMGFGALRPDLLPRATAASGPAIGQHGMDRETAHPGRERAFASERGELPPCLDEDLLGHVFGDRRQNVDRGVAKAAGLDPAIASKLMAMASSLK